MGWKTGVKSRAVTVTGALVALLVLLVACGGGDTKDKADSDSSGGQTKELKWAACMRDAGVNVPDPQPGKMPLVPQGTDESKVEAARQKCKEFDPQGKVTDEKKQAWASELRKFSKCMRENGVKNQPDPDENGTLLPPEGEDTDAPRYKSAEAKCQKYLESFEKQQVG
jgi:hypothetical protein